MNTENDIKELMSVYDKAHHEGNGSLLAGLFMDDGVIIPPNKPKLQGRSSIDQFYSGVNGGSQMNTGSVSIEVDQNMAYVNGETSWKTADQTRYLSFVNVLKMHNGKWRYKLLTWNTNEGYLQR